MSAFFFESSSL